MTREKRSEDLRHLLEERFRKLSRIEKVFYVTLAVTGLMMAISVIYMQIRHQQIQQEISAINKEILVKQEALNEAKQEVNELTRLDRITGIVSQSDIKTQSNNLEKVD